MHWVECRCGARFSSTESVQEALLCQQTHAQEMAALDEFNCGVVALSIRDEGKEVRWPTKHDAEDAMPRSSGC